MRNNNVYRTKGAILMLFIPLLIINSIFTKNYEYAFVTRIICLSISILILIISNLPVKNRDLGIIKYIGVGYFYIVILRFLDLEKMWISGQVTLYVNFTYITAYIELFNILISMIFYNLKKKIVYKYLINLINIFSIYILIKYNEVVLHNSVKSIVFFSLIICTVLIGLIFYNGYKLKFEYKSLFVFSLLVYIAVILYSLGLKYNEVLFGYVGLIKIISYFIIYEFVESNILSLTYLNAYKNLKDLKDKKILLNKRLNQRNNELSDLNTLIEKSEQNYYKIITALSTSLIVFENNKMIYSNIRDLNVLNKVVIKDNFEDNYKNTLPAVVEKYCDIDCEDNIEDFVLLKDIKLNNGDDIKLEISLITINNDKRILLLKDITKIIKQREEFINLEKNIKDEILKEEFHSNISHELRTPINVIYSALQLKKLLIKEEKYESLIENNNVIRQNCLRLIRTIDNFIDSNKLSDNKLEYDKKIYNLVDIIDSIINVTNVYMKNKNIELTFEPEYEEIYFMCEKNYIERIMLNILSNSVKYGSQNGKISIYLNVKNDKINILVKNNNDAIPLNKQKEVFEKFTKINNTLNRPTEGSGLGLFLTKGLVELHNGNIRLTSKVGVGNKFIIEFPFDPNINDLSFKANNNFEANELSGKLNKDFEIGDLYKKAEIEFADIYF